MPVIHLLILKNLKRQKFSWIQHCSIELALSFAMNLQGTRLAISNLELDLYLGASIFLQNIMRVYILFPYNYIQTWLISLLLDD